MLKIHLKGKLGTKLQKRKVKSLRECQRNVDGDLIIEQRSNIAQRQASDGSGTCPLHNNKRCGSSITVTQWAMATPYEETNSWIRFSAAMIAHDVTYCPASITRPRGNSKWQNKWSNYWHKYENMIHSDLSEKCMNGSPEFRKATLSVLSYFRDRKKLLPIQDLCEEMELLLMQPLSFSCTGVGS